MLRNGDGAQWGCCTWADVVQWGVMNMGCCACGDGGHGGGEHGRYCMVMGKDNCKIMGKGTQCWKNKT